MLAALPEPLLSWLILPMLLALSLGVGWLVAGSISRLPAHSPAERVALLWLLGVVTLSWIGTALAALGVFHPWSIGLSVALLAAVVRRRDLGRLWRRERPRTRGEEPSPPHPTQTEPPQVSPRSELAPTPRLVVVTVVALLILSGWLFARPAESFFLVDDSAVYAIGGVSLARTGSLLFQPATFLPTTDDLTRQFMGLDSYLQTVRHYGPFFQWTKNVPTVEIGFLPLPKIWLALSVWLFGASHAGWPTALMGLTGVMALYALARRLVGWRTGLAAAALLAVSFPQIWFSRYPISEAYTQALFLGGLYLAVLARQNAEDRPLSRDLAIWSGVALAALTVLRFEAALIIVLLVVFARLTWRPAAWRANGFARAWLASLLLASGYGMAVSLLMARHYWFSQTLSTLTPQLSRGVLVLLMILLLGGVWGWQRKWHHAEQISASLARGARWLPWVVLAGWLAWIALALWKVCLQDRGSSLPGWLTLYLSRPGVAVSSLGIAGLLFRERRDGERPELVTFLGLAAVFLLSYTINPLVNAVQPWAMRRLVPIVLPALALGAGWLLTDGLLELRGRWRRTQTSPVIAYAVAAGAIVLLCAQVGLIAQRSWPILTHTEQAGLYDQLRGVADRLPADAVVLFDNGQVGKRLTQAFELVFGHPTLAIQHNPEPNGSAVDRLLDSVLGQGRQAYFVVTDGDLVWQPERWQLVGRGVSNIATATLRTTQGRMPDATDIVSRTLRLEIYEIRPATNASAGPQLPLDVPVGEGGFAYFGEGFWGWALDDHGAPFRWTDGDGSIELPWPEADPNRPANACLVLEVAGGRPADAAQVELNVLVEGGSLYDGELKPGYGPQLLKLPLHDQPNRDADALQVRLESGTWTPDGDKPLGVLVRQVQLRQSADCAK